MFRDDVPWIYELGVEAYRASLTGRPEKAREAQRRFAMACRAVRRGPFMDMFGDKDVHMLMHDLMHFLEREDFFLEHDQVTDPPTNKKRRIKPDEGS
jgi:hypothetical protein